MKNPLLCPGRSAQSVRRSLFFEREVGVQVDLNGGDLLVAEP